VVRSAIGLGLAFFIDFVTIMHNIN